MNNVEFSELVGRSIDANVYAPFAEWDEQAVKDALLTLYKKKPDVKTNEIPSGFYRRVQFYFGGFKEATKQLGIVRDMTGKKGNKPIEKWTDDYILECINSYIMEGKTLKEIRDADNNLMCAIQRKYGPFKNFEEKFRINITRSSRKSQGRKYSDEQLKYFIQYAVELELSGAKAKQKNEKLFSACRIRWGSWNKALIANGYEPLRTSPRKDWTKEELKRIYLAEISSGVRREDVSNPHAIRKLFGGITQLRAELGLDNVQDEKQVLSKEIVEQYVNQALNLDVDNINEQILDDINANLTHSIKHYYGSTAAYFSMLDIDRYKKPYTPFTWTKENIVWQIERWIREGCPVNYTAIQSRHKGIIVASRRLFGSYEKAFKYAGLNYDDYRIDTAMASRQGAEFERIVADILSDIGVEYLREPSINGCHPDFVVGKHWIDAKLSEWTISFADCSTIHKYMPHCRKLTIVYLRQLKDETYRTNELGIDMLHVSELLKELPNNKASEYQRKLDAILDALKENAA